jgi:hypothetical protein
VSNTSDLNSSPDQSELSNRPHREIIRDFTSRKNRPWLLVAIGSILVVSAWKLKLGEPRPDHPRRREPDTIAYHYEQWQHERRYLKWGNRPKGFNLHTLSWYLDGKPTFGQRLEAAEQHELALIRLGYFEERKFDWPSGDINLFISNFINQAEQTELKQNWSVHYVRFGETNLIFTARKQDMPMIESLYMRLTRSSMNQFAPLAK